MPMLYCFSLVASLDESVSSCTEAKRSDGNNSDRLVRNGHYQLVVFSFIQHHHLEGQFHSQYLLLSI